MLAAEAVLAIVAMLDVAAIPHGFQSSRGGAA